MTVLSIKRINNKYSKTEFINLTFHLSNIRISLSLMGLKAYLKKESKNLFFYILTTIQNLIYVACEISSNYS